MAQALIVVMAALQVAAFFSRVMRKRWQAVLLLVGSALLPLAYAGIMYLSTAWNPPDWKMLIIPVGAIALVLLSLWRPLGLVFWLGWLLNLWFVSSLFYLAFFWHPFG